MRKGKRCTVIGCEQLAVAKGLCGTHYKRVQRHGDVSAGRPDGWGDVYNSNLGPVWKGIMRYHKLRCDSRWFDFSKFVEDVGAPPENSSVRFNRVDRKKPYGPDNWFWQELDLSQSDAKQRARDYQKRLRDTNPDYFRDYDLRKNYGVTLEWYNEQFSKQNGVCAICGKPETALIRGKAIQLSVDHCHTTGKVRGLLCRRCNNGIGHLNHDVQLLTNAVKYLTD